MDISSRISHPAKEAGFTLLETLIAVAIMLVAFSAILMVESASLNTSFKAKQMNIVAMLAKEAMVKAENEFEGKAFEEVPKEASGHFDPPYQDYRWSRVIKEIRFPSLSMGGNIGGGEGGDDGGSSSNNAMETLTKLLTNFLSKALREVSVTVSWKKGSGEQSFSLSTYWVDLNHEFELSE